MQVSSQSDSITHAVVGQVQSTKMGVSSSAALMHILSTALYTYPWLAAVREVICNGDDIHKVTGLQDTPLDITLTDSMFSVRDYGTGIAHDDIGPIYGVFGDSTKRNDSMQTGGFGVGSKAPFAYADNFEVRSYHQGTLSIYRISKSSMAVDGAPSIDLIAQMPTTETGLKVSIDLQEGHILKFMEMVQQVLRQGEIKANINGGLFEDLMPLNDAPHGFVLARIQGDLLSEINIRYGAVVYPVSRHDEYGVEYDRVQHMMREVSNGTRIVFQAPPDMVTIAPSREALILTEVTVRTIKEILGNFTARSSHNVARAVQVAKNTAVNKTIKETDISTLMDALQANDDSAVAVVGYTHDTDKYAYTFRKAMTMGAISRKQPRFLDMDDSWEKILRMARKDATPKNRRFIDDLRKKASEKVIHKIAKKDTIHYWSVERQAKWVAREVAVRHVIAPVMVAIKQSPIMNIERFSLGFRKYSWGSLYQGSLKQFELHDRSDVLVWLKPKVLIVRAKTAVSKFFDNYKDSSIVLKERKKHGWLIYQCTAHDTTQQKAVEFFQNLGLEVEVYIPAKKIKEVDPLAPVKEKKPAVKREGYLRLSESVGHIKSKGFTGYTVANARENADPKNGLENPIAYTELYGARGDCRSIPHMSRDQAAIVNRMFGKQVAVVNAAQAEKLKKEGVPELSNFMNKYVDKTLSAHKELGRILAFHSQLHEGVGEASDDILKLITTEFPSVCELSNLRLRFSVSAEVMVLFQYYSESYSYQREKKFPLMADKEKVVKPYPEMASLRKRIEGSPILPFVNVDVIRRTLQKPPVAPELLSGAESLLTLILKDV